MSTKEEENIHRTLDAVEKPALFKLVMSPKFLFGALLVYAGLFVPILMRGQYDWLVIFKDQAPIIIGVLSALIGVSFLSTEYFKVKRTYREDRFIDIDKDRQKDDYISRESVIKELNAIKNKPEIISEGKVEELVEKVLANKAENRDNLFDSFESYFYEIRKVFLEQAHIADKKASALLDKGTSYSKGGITFFLASILIWQFLFWLTGFKDHYIYGLVSCSLLFIFVEFLAAWFLKQYRHFVDTSTYLIKVKSIFDRYMMSYLAIKSLGSERGNEEVKYQAMIKVLEDDIKWPETYLLKNGDVSFAKEALETMTHFAKAMRSEVKSQGK